METMFNLVTALAGLVCLASLLIPAAIGIGLIVQMKPDRPKRTRRRFQRRRPQPAPYQRRLRSRPH